ncbi:MAG: uncharacterized membrane-anchored protein YitT (DUF2179 family) [Saprospiraceae bacterium]|jgi:uncharacterized membrane-anchored protein YitT (DUF2179 family)
MSSLFQKIVTNSLKRKYKNREEKLTDTIITKGVNDSKVTLKHLFRDSFFILLGVVSAAFGLKGFLLPNGFIDGGVTGISLLTEKLTDVPLPILILVINLPFLVLGFSTVGKQFVIRSVVAIMLLSIAVHILYFPVITDDKLLIAAFGGFFLGLGIGLVVRGGAVIDGTEVLAIFISKKTSMTIGDVILVFNVVIFGFGAYVLSIEIALYAMLTYMVASKTVDFIIDGIEEYLGVTIISQYSEEVRLAIIENLGRGCTMYTGKNGYAPKGAELKDLDIVYTVITRLELAKLHTELDKVDPEAFVIMNSIKDAKGGMIKKRPFKD